MWVSLAATKQSSQMAYIDKQYSLLHNQVYAVQKGLLQMQGTEG